MNPGPRVSAHVSLLTRINVLLNAEDAERFAAYCSRNGFKKSTLIARLVRDFLEREGLAPPQKRRAKAARKEDAA